MVRRLAAVDAALYGAALVFTLIAATLASIPIHREWGRIALAPYGIGVAASIVLAIRGGPRRARAIVAGAVLVGAALLPLALEITWRARTSPGLHAQSEVIITEEAANVLLDGSDPYATTYLHGPLEARPLGTKTHFPYLPGMLVFGLPRAVDGHHPLADARVGFTLATVGIAAVALLRLAPEGSGLRAFQFLAILPTGALLMATGGDDLPVLAALLLALVLAARGRPLEAGIVTGLAAATKQTAWVLVPFLVLALLRAQGRRAAGKFMAATAVVALPVIVAFAAWDPGAFWEDAILFPLGLGMQRTAAATPTLGSALIRILPVPRGLLTALLAMVVGMAAIYALIRRPPASIAGAAGRAAAVLALAFILAPAARLGYVVYPIDLWVWTALLANSPAQVVVNRRTAGS